MAQGEGAEDNREKSRKEKEKEYIGIERRGRRKEGGRKK